MRLVRIPESKYPRPVPLVGIRIFSLNKDLTAILPEHLERRGLLADRDRVGLVRDVEVFSHRFHEPLEIDRRRHGHRPLRNVVREEFPERGPLEIDTVPSDERRSYHICSERIRRELDFAPQHSIEEAVRDLVRAFRQGLLPNAMTDIRYHNIKTLQELHREGRL